MTQESSAGGSGPSMTSPFSHFASFTFPAASQSTTPQPAAQQQVQPPPTQPAFDPFAAFAAAKPAAPATDDEEWNFTSSLPPAAPSKPREHKSLVSDTGLRAEFLAKRVGANNSINIVFSFSNNTAQPITELHFQLAVTKVRLRAPSRTCEYSLLTSRLLAT